MKKHEFDEVFITNAFKNTWDGAFNVFGDFKLKGKSNNYHFYATITQSNKLYLHIESNKRRSTMSDEKKREIIVQILQEQPETRIRLALTGFFHKMEHEMIQ